MNLDFVSATADIRGDYRYRLTRVWDPTLPTITFVLLNPSTADAVVAVRLHAPNRRIGFESPLWKHPFALGSHHVHESRLSVPGRPRGNPSHRLPGAPGEERVTRRPVGRKVRWGRGPGSGASHE